MENAETPKLSLCLELTNAFADAIDDIKPTLDDQLATLEALVLQTLEKMDDPELTEWWLEGLKREMRSRLGQGSA
jgi:hypothetical protein